MYTSLNSPGHFSTSSCWDGKLPRQGHHRHGSPRAGILLCSDLQRQVPVIEPSCIIHWIVHPQALKTTFFLGNRSHANFHRINKVGKVLKDHLVQPSVHHQYCPENYIPNFELSSYLPITSSDIYIGIKQSFPPQYKSAVMNSLSSSWSFPVCEAWLLTKAYG